MFKKSFTLIEMIVVIGIIAILVTLGFASYSTVQKKARDSRRKGDLNSMQKVLEQCYTVNNYKYPSIIGNEASTASTDCTAEGGTSIEITDPTDKKFTITGGNGDSYTISIPLEDTTTYTISNQQ